MNYASYKHFRILRSLPYNNGGDGIEIVDGDHDGTAKAMGDMKGGTSSLSMDIDKVIGELIRIDKRWHGFQYIRMEEEA